jgi:hypothetical protein
MRYSRCVQLQCYTSLRRFNPSFPIRASPISGLLSAMMISSDGTQFRLDFLVVQIQHGDFELA